MRAMILISACLFAFAAEAEVIRKWITPEGTVFLGDRPPEGSVLAEVFELPDPNEQPSPEEVAAREKAQSAAAADGREIIRRRAAEREAERERYTYRVPEEDFEQPGFVIMTGRDDFFFGRDPFPGLMPRGGVARSLRDEGIGSTKRIPPPFVGPPLPPSRPGETALVPMRRPPRHGPRFSPRPSFDGRPPGRFHKPSRAGGFSRERK